MRRALLAIAIACGAAATSADASIWQDAIELGSPDRSKDVYDAEMRAGDEHVGFANSRSGSRSEMKRQVNLALQSYRNAAAARPTEADPYFRIGNVLNSFYLDSCEDQSHIGVLPSPLRDCTDPSKIDVAITKQTIDAWNAAEARAPLDPRFSADGNSILFERALLNTKLATPQTLEAAARDYVAYLDRGDGRGEGMENAWANLAETYMMLNKLDDAIDAYREALRVGGDVSTSYGYAVALDRAERGPTALAVVRAQGPDGFDVFKHRVHRNLTFYVPQGEVFYYYGLIHEAMGSTEDAIDAWQMYIRSGAHPQYQPRAKEHLNALLAKKRTRPVPPRDPFMDMR